MNHGWSRRIILLTLVASILISCGDPAVGPLVTNGVADKVTLRQAIRDIAYLESADSGAIDAAIVVSTLDLDGLYLRGAVLAAMTTDRGLLSPPPVSLTGNGQQTTPSRVTGLLSSLGTTDIKQKTDTVNLIWPDETVRLTLTDLIPADIIVFHMRSDTVVGGDTYTIPLPGRQSDGLTLRRFDFFTPSDPIIIPRTTQLQPDSGRLVIERITDVNTTLISLRRSFYRVIVSPQGKRIGIVVQALHRYEITWRE
jgi:hypothetical protein